MTADSNEIPVTRSSFAARVLRAARLDASLFDEIEHAPDALAQSASVVVVAGLARGLGAAPREGWVGLTGSVVVALALWLVATLVIHAIASRYLRSAADFQQLLRTVGFAAAPLWLLALRAFPLGAFDPVLSLLGHGLATGALLVAVRQGLEIDTPRAALVVCGALGLGIAGLAVLSVLIAG